MTVCNFSNILIQSVDIGGRRIIDNVKFRLNPCDIQLLKAPNGTGKSVLLSILAGWDEDIISVRIAGNYKNKNQNYDLRDDIKKFRNYARQRIGYLSHKLNEESLGVKFEEEIGFIIKKYTIIPEVFHDTIEYLKANNKDDFLVDKMSKGHRQLMAILDVLSGFENYDLILLDEPTSYLNDSNFECFIRQINFISQVSNCPILIASNDHRLFNRDFTKILLSNKERLNKYFNVAKAPALINIKSTSIKVKGYPLGHSGQLPLYFNEQIKENESVIIVGANGCGKSTFLNVCTGLMRINGTIDHYSGNKKIKARQLFPYYLSLLFQDPRDYEFRNTSDEVLSIFDYAEDKQYFFDLYEKILSYYSIPRNQNPKTLSSGQLRMLWLLSMLGWSARWVLDEPDASLDEKSLNLFFQLLDIHIAKKGTVIIVTHSKELYQKYNFRTIEL